MPDEQELPPLTEDGELAMEFSFPGEVPTDVSAQDIDK